MKKTLKVSGWTFWGDDRFPDYSPATIQEMNEAMVAVAKEIRKSGYHITGFLHQSEYETCVPIISGKGRLECSFRKWGEIMAVAYPEEVGVRGYQVWAWSAPSGIPVSTPFAKEVKNNGI